MKKIAHTKFLYVCLFLIHLVLSYLFFAKVITNSAPSKNLEYVYGTILLIFGCFSIVAGPVIMSGNR